MVNATSTTGARARSAGGEPTVIAPNAPAERRASAGANNKTPASGEERPRAEGPAQGSVGSAAKARTSQSDRGPRVAPSKNAAAPVAPREANAARELEALIAGAIEGLEQLQRATNRVASPALASAAAKIELARTTLQPGAASLGDALGELMRLQGEQTAQRSADARGQIRSKLKQHQTQTLRQLDEIAKRAKAAGKSKFWGTLISVFKAVASAITIAAGVLTANPLLIAGAVLMLASLITSLASKSDAAKWTAMGLGVAGAVLSGGAGFIGSAAGSASTLTKLVGDAALQVAKNVTWLAPSAANAAASALHVPQGMAASEGASAEAELAELRLWAQRLLKGADDEREVLRTVLETQNRAVELIARSLETNERGMAAVVAEGR